MADHAYEYVIVGGGLTGASAVDGIRNPEASCGGTSTLPHSAQ